MTVSCTFFEVAETRRVIRFPRRTGAFSGLLLLRCTISFRSLHCDRGPGEGELGRSRLPLSLPSLFMSCLKLHDSPLEHFPFANHCLPSPCVSFFPFASVLCFPSDWSCTRCPVASSIEVSILRHLIQAPVDHNSSSVCSWFVLLYCILTVQCKCGLELFRISELYFVHTFQHVILGSLPKR